ncbi:GNAT family N-acetyltransferase [Ruegeria faecimaris]|uniref:GNAT family N-acetyltransferase n=1 Tax=Ruegeria faecimaris TaxID=686389 RepID=UPI002491C6D8|nr:GNAT family N-acetyltransferase [Ruegeria faecimaris]
MIPDQFTTERLGVCHWQVEVSEAGRLSALTAELATVLTPAVLEPLPPSMQVEETPSGMTDWIAARKTESDVLLVRLRQNNQLIGLLILASEPEDQAAPAIHLGYLFAERAWGCGYATELVSGFIAACGTSRAIRFLAGVEHSNPASARVLQKSGFTRSSAHSTDDTDMYVCDIS